MQPDLPAFADFAFGNRDGIGDELTENEAPAPDEGGKRGDGRKDDQLDRQALQEAEHHADGCENEADGNTDDGRWQTEFRRLGERRHWLASVAAGSVACGANGPSTRIR